MHTLDEPAAGSPHRSRRRYQLVLVVTAFIVLALDQVTKTWALRSLDEPIDLVWTLRLRLAFNTGTAFSLGSGLGPVIGVGALVIVVLLYRAGRGTASATGAVALGLVMGGAVGNLVDRAFRAGSGFFGGAVVDFIDLQWWPIFNVADMGIVVGGILLLATSLGRGRPSSAATAGELER